ncbi:uncharacterized protein LOC575072 [Strongylocentrotus purpuratus]|uniref:Uncharacterized protein n=1 Tax=Strongylocentrotus purpuratus TaxID=7668 RepID=A0A7M7N3K2_STRPU|nr:uncharacterized protein LOC575072 [Strongylocentrotus purpuratus]
MKNLVFVSIFSAMVAIGTAHLCMLSPPQRGSMLNINKPASPDCALLPEPCGGRNASLGTTLAIKEGSRFVVAFQKNLDHFYPSNPGSFKISLSFDEEKTFQLLQFLPDTSDPSLTLYYMNVTMPAMPLKKPGTLRIAYVTQNPEAPAVFYQCSDIMLY